VSTGLSGGSHSQNGSAVVNSGETQLEDRSREVVLLGITAHPRTNSKNPPHAEEGQAALTI